MNYQKQYFPFCLANGLDSVMIDYSGSMHCDSGHLHLEQHEGAICCWEKLSHRTRTRRMIPIVQFPYRITGADGELFEVGSFKQSFNPVTAIMTTFIEACIIKMKITTFLRDDGLYVEHYNVLWTAEGTSPSIIFYGRIPRIWHINLEHPAIKKINMGYTAPTKNMLFGEYSFENIKGNICMAAASKLTSRIVSDRTDDAAGIELLNLRKGDVITRYISVQDNSHSRNPGDDCIKLVSNALKTGFEKVKKEHQKIWKNYFRNTQVKLPDAEMQKLYNTSLWLMRASQNRNTGFTTEGLYDAFKGGGYACFWDMTFVMRAWVTANQKKYASSLLDFYQSCLPIAEKYASQLGRKGAYYPWMCNSQGLSTYFDDAREKPGIQKWNNCCMLLQLFDPYRFNGDKRELKKRIPLIKKIIDFLIDEIVIPEKDRYIIKPLEGADENIPRKNDTAHLIPLIQGLKGYIKGISILGQKIDPLYRKILSGLEKSLQNNIKDGLIYPWENADRTTAQSFTFALFCHPEGIGKKSLMDALKISKGEWGLTNPGTYRNLIWPWTETRAAIAFSNLNPKITFERLRHVVKFTSTHGIFPEKIRPDGFPILFGYLTAHASFVYAVNSMLASDNGKTIYIAAGIPHNWKDLKFSNISTPSGLIVSLYMKERKIKHLSVKNTRSEKKFFSLELPFGKKIKYTLKPGINIIELKI